MPTMMTEKKSRGRMEKEYDNLEQYNKAGELG